MTTAATDGRAVINALFDLHIRALASLPDDEAAMLAVRVTLPADTLLEILNAARSGLRAQYASNLHGSHIEDSRAAILAAYTAILAAAEVQP